MICTKKYEQMKSHLIELDNSKFSSSLIWNTFWFFSPVKPLFLPNNYLNEFAFIKHMATALGYSKKMWQVGG